MQASRARLGTSVPAAARHCANAHVSSSARAVHTVSTSIGDKQLSLETGRIGPLADSVVFARYGNTSMLVSAVSGRQIAEEDFLPLQVDYRERAFARGLIPTTATRKEASSNDREVLGARIIDRTLRPLFPEGYFYETQLIATLTSFDPDADPEMLSVIASSAALHASDIPFNGPAAAVAVGIHANTGAPIVAPARNAPVRMNLLYAGSAGRVLMIEADGQEAPEPAIVAAMRAGQAALLPILDMQHQLAEQVGKTKRKMPLMLPSEEVQRAAMDAIFLEAKDTLAASRESKADRSHIQAALQGKAIRIVQEKFPDEHPRKIGIAVEAVVRQALRAVVLDAAGVFHASDAGVAPTTATGPQATTQVETNAQLAGVASIDGNGPASDPASAAAVVGPDAHGPEPTTTASITAAEDEVASNAAGKIVAPVLGQEAASGATASAAEAGSLGTATAPPPQGSYRIFDAPAGRVDGRGTQAVRQLSAAIDVIPLVHGSALFSRGSTQVLSAATLGPLTTTQMMVKSTNGFGAALAKQGANSADGSDDDEAGAAASGTADASSTSAGASANSSTTPSSGPAAVTVMAPMPIVDEEEAKSFFLHYDFPPYCTNETGKIGGVNRRAVGHGALAEKAVAAVMPPPDQFPYTVRVVSETAGSDGSSSMATVCSATLSLMDAGVPLKAPVAGISIGAITTADKGPLQDSSGGMAAGDGYLLLTDIFGLEDHAGDMDFKVAGSREGVTAIQLDVKPAGLPLEVLEQALWRAQTARHQILDVMAGAIAKPRPELKTSAPRVQQLLVPPELRSRLVGPGGSNLRRIEMLSTAQLVLDEDALSGTGASRLFIYGSAEALAAAGTLVDSAVQEHLRVTGSPLTSPVMTPEVRAAFPHLVVGVPVTLTVQKINEFGAVLGWKNKGPEAGWLHVSELTRARHHKVSDYVCEGDEVTVQVCDVDAHGRGKFSVKALLRPGQDVSMHIRRRGKVRTIGPVHEPKKDVKPAQTAQAAPASAQTATAAQATTPAAAPAAQPAATSEVAAPEAAPAAAVEPTAAPAAVVTSSEPSALDSTDALIEALSAQSPIATTTIEHVQPTAGQVQAAAAPAAAQTPEPAARQASGPARGQRDVSSRTDSRARGQSTRPAPQQTAAAPVDTKQAASAASTTLSDRILSAPHEKDQETVVEGAPKHSGAATDRRHTGQAQTQQAGRQQAKIQPQSAAAPASTAAAPSSSAPTGQAARPTSTPAPGAMSAALSLPSYAYLAGGIKSALKAVSSTSTTASAVSSTSATGTAKVASTSSSNSSGGSAGHGLPLQAQGGRPGQSTQDRRGSSPPPGHTGATGSATSQATGGNTGKQVQNQGQAPRREVQASLQQVQVVDRRAQDSTRPQQQQQQQNRGQTRTDGGGRPQKGPGNQRQDGRRPQNDRQGGQHQQQQSRSDRAGSQRQRPDRRQQTQTVVSSSPAAADSSSATSAPVAVAAPSPAAASVPSSPSTATTATTAAPAAAPAPGKIITPSWTKGSEVSITVTEMTPGTAKVSTTVDLRQDGAGPSVATTVTGYVQRDTTFPMGVAVGGVYKARVLAFMSPASSTKSVRFKILQ